MPLFKMTECLTPATRTVGQLEKAKRAALSWYTDNDGEAGEDIMERIVPCFFLNEHLSTQDRIVQDRVWVLRAEDTENLGFTPEKDVLVETVCEDDPAWIVGMNQKVIRTTFGEIDFSGDYFPRYRGVRVLARYIFSEEPTAEQLALLRKGATK